MPPPLPYEPPQSQNPAPSQEWFSVAGVILGGVVAVFGLGIIIVAQKFEVILSDFKAQIPGITGVLFSVCRVVSSQYFTPLIIFPLAGGFLLPLTKRRGGTGVIRTSIVAVIVWLLLAIAAIFVVLALFLPMVSLMDHAAGGK